MVSVLVFTLTNKDPIRSLVPTACLLVAVTGSRTGTRRRHAESIDFRVLGELDGGLAAGWLSDFARWTRTILVVLWVGDLG